MLVSKHGDPIMGVDIHLLTFPPAPAPVPVPHPHSGFVMDMMDYIPVMGSTISINGVPRSQAGTAGQAIPHLPMGGIWVPPPPLNEEEIFMGSLTIEADGAPLTYGALPVLTCQSIGMMAPIRLKKPKKSYGMVLPTSMVTATPGGMPVMIGSIGLVPTIDIMGAVGAGGMKALGPLGKMAKRAAGGKGAKIWKTAATRFNTAVGAAMNKVGLSKFRNKVQDSVCSVTGHPVNVATGQLYTEAIDFELPGPIPFTLSRVWRSTSKNDADFGKGWHHSFDIKLFVVEGVSLVQLADGRVAEFLTPKNLSPSYNKQEQLYLYVESGRYYLKDLKGNFKVFGEPLGDNSARYLLWEADSHGNRISFERRGIALTKITDSCGRELHINTDNHNRITEVIGPHPESINQKVSLIKYQYSQEGDLICVKDAYDHPFKYFYENHLLVKETDREGFSFYFEFNTLWKQSGDSTQAYCIKTWGDGNLFYRELEYDLESQYTKSIDSKGGVTHYYWNDLGVVTMEVNPVGGKSQTSFDEFANKVKEIDALGNETSYEIDEMGQVLSITDPEGNVTTAEYDDRNNIASLENSNGQKWHFEYDNYHNTTARILPDGSRIDYLYDQRGLLSELKSEGQNQSFSWHKGLLYQAVSTKGLIQTFMYDALGRNIEVKDFDNKSSYYCYDLLGRLVCKTNREGLKEHYDYNLNGQLISHSNALSHTTRFEYTYIALTKKVLASGREKKYLYDTELNLIELTNENKDSCRFKYDQHERLIEEIAYDGRVQRYEYNEIDSLITHSDGQFRSIHYVRNFSGQVLEKLCSDGDKSTFSYDSLGNMLLAENKHCLAKFEYDDLGRLVSEQQGESALKHTYNVMGERIQSILPNGDVLDFNYGGHSDLEEVVYNGRSLCKSSYDKLGREVERQAGGVKQTQEYDVMGRLKSLSVHGKSSRVIDRGYSYDAAGRLKAIQDSNLGNTSIDYDPLERVTNTICRSPESFVFDPAGNLSDDQKVQGSGYSQGNRLLYFEDKHFEYDDVGNMVKESSGKAQCKVKEFTYDHQNQMISAFCNGQVFHYEYDALGRRVSKEDTFGKTFFIWSGDVLLSEKRNNIEKLYIYEPDSFRPLCQIVDQKFHYFHLDQAGAPREITSESGGIVWQATYKVHGNVISFAHEEIENNLRFQGQYFDSETGLHYNRFRYYHPGIGRFINQDPIGLAGGEHLYEYSPNPFGWVDPLGLQGHPYKLPAEPDWKVYQRGKHIAPKGLSTKKIRQGTQNGPAKYYLDNAGDVKKLELDSWRKGTQVKSKPNFKVLEHEDVIGAKFGRDSKWQRMEYDKTSNTIHGHPITKEEYVKYLSE